MSRQSDYDDHEWLKRWRKSAFDLMKGFAATTSISWKRKRSKLKKLREEVAKLTKEVYEKCPHPLESQIYREEGHQDTLGNWTSHGQNYIRCRECGTTLWEKSY